MEAITIRDDLRNIYCCNGGQGAFVDSIHEVQRSNSTAATAIASSKQQLQQHHPSPRKVRPAQKQKRMSSFTLPKWKPKSTSFQGPESASTDCVSISSYDDGDDVSEFPAQHLSGQREKRSYDELFSMPSLLDEHEEDPSIKQTVAAAAGSHEHRRGSSTVSQAISEEEYNAMEVGASAHDYLEECFLYTEVSVLDKKKFDAIPQVVKSDFDIKRHLGKGSYSDVFEVICKKGHTGLTTKQRHQPNNSSGNSRRPSRARRSSMALSNSITVATLSRPTNTLRNDTRPRYAMKCLRPQIRSNFDEFTIGAEDIVHETAILANLDHPNIIKLHGRASGHLTDAFVLNDSYFILLDKLDETLQQRIKGWKKNSKQLALGPTSTQIEMAGTIADAMSYLHSKNVLFRDLKPANVGIDSMGVLKLFDFGFAIGLPEKDEMNPEGFLFDRCGTPRYMSPEVGLSLGYGLPADVYSFGMLLWEMCSFEMPFSHIKSPAQFDKEVFMEGHRPELDRRWPASLRQLMSNCWSSSPSHRPSMLDVKLELSMIIFNMTDIDASLTDSGRSRRSKLMSRGMRMSSMIVN